MVYIGLRVTYIQLTDSCISNFTQTQLCRACKTQLCWDMYVLTSRQTSRIKTVCMLRSVLILENYRSTFDCRLVDKLTILLKEKSVRTSTNDWKPLTNFLTRKGRCMWPLGALKYLRAKDQRVGALGSCEFEHPWFPLSTGGSWNNPVDNEG